MKFIFAILPVILMLIACPRRADPPCHAQVFHEDIIRIYHYDTGVTAYEEYFRSNIRCAGKCPDGTPCDSIVELTHSSMGLPIRRIRCGCESEQPNHSCGIVIQRNYFPPDSVETILDCTHDAFCPITSDTCKFQDQRLPNDTIRSRINGSDSLIIKKWLVTCECMGE